MQPHHTPAEAPLGEYTVTPPSAEKTLQWITVLSAAGMHYRLSHEDGAWRLHIPASQSAAALSEIQAFEEDENHPARPAKSRMYHHTSPATNRMANWTAFWTTYILSIFYISLGSFDAANPMHLAGAMSRTEFLQGEWWRGITALTLHSGLAHLMANALFLLFVGQAVIRELGRGLGLAMILAGGITGNYMASLTAPSYQRSVGASTACFAALGILCVMQAGHLYRRHRAWSTVWRITWIPIAGGIALLGLTGASPGSDIAAHLFGFFCGMLIALPAAYWSQRIHDISVAMQWALVIIAALLPAMAWFFAYLHA